MMKKMKAVQSQRWGSKLFNKIINDRMQQRRILVCKHYQTSAASSKSLIYLICFQAEQFTRSIYIWEIQTHEIFKQQAEVLIIWYLLLAPLAVLL